MLPRALRLGLGSSKEPETEYHRLWGCNEPPSERERALVISRIHQLQSRLQRIASTPRLSLQAPKEAQRVEVAILRHKGLLSCVRRVPPEIWGNIFEFVPEDPGRSISDPTNRYDIALQRLCGVCSNWNKIAKSIRGLWTRLPTFSFGETSPIPAKSLPYQAVQRRLELYLSSSGSLPISFAYVHCIGVAELDNQYTSLMILKRLMKESSRWLEVQLTVPWELVEHLSSVRGAVPILSKLHLVIRPPMVTNRITVARLGAFALAPSLRHMTFNLPSGSDTSFAGFDVLITLPWAQMETYASSSRSDITYGEVLRASIDVLTSVSCSANTMWFIVPRSGPEPILLTRLTKLHLRFGHWLQGGPPLPGIAFLDHLGLLTLPALEDLEVSGRGPPATSDVVEAVARLTRRSSCSLKHLALGEKVPFIVPANPQFIEWKALWTKLTHLDVRCPSRKDIHTLNLFAQGHSSFTFPELQVLTLRRHALERPPTPRSDEVVHPETFLLMLKSRTSAPSSEHNSPPTNIISLREVRFIYTEPPFVGCWRRPQVEAFEAYGKVPFGDVDVEGSEVETWAAGLDKAFCSLCPAPHSALGFVDQRNISSRMKQLEQLRLEERCSRALVRRGLVYVLYRLSLKRDGVIPGDTFFKFRKRAKNLCEKWKPFLLRDHRASPYRFCYWAHNHWSVRLKMKYVPAGSLRDTDEEAWNEVLGLDTVA